MPLSTSAFVALAATCAPSVAPETLLAVARVESALDPLAIGVNGRGGGRRPAGSVDEAIRIAEQLIDAGRSIDLGLGQINVRNLGWLGLSVADAFDPCLNLAASARVLADGYRRAGPSPGREQLTLRVALSYYNTGTAHLGFRNGYVARVAAAVRPSSSPVLRTNRAGQAASSGRPVRISFVIHPSPGGQP